MAFSRSRLTTLQRRFLEAFVARSSAFFLTGGAVLAGWVLGHRPTADLDLFTTDDGAMSDGDRLVRGAAAEVDATVEIVRSEPDFRRYLVRAVDEGLIVDLVRDRVPQLRPKVDRDGVLTDSVEEIVANKICALVGRSEIRDLVDLYFLEQAGFRVERFVADAARKDGGVTPATVAWILSRVTIPRTLPEGVDVETLRAFARDLEGRMRRLAARDPGSSAPISEDRAPSVGNNKLDSPGLSC
ncbi:MAG: nucleotidyl transferase AbiEii/AbiGii toxin family protein [Candidatus Rokuibacteriota bacterium]